MATFVFDDAAIYYGDTDMSGFSNSVTAGVEADELDVSTFGDSFRTRIAGPRMGSLEISGFAQTDAADDNRFFGVELFGSTLYVTVAADTAVGSSGIASRYKLNSRTRGGTYGQASEWSASLVSIDRVWQGKLLLPKASYTGITTGTAVQLRAVQSGEQLVIVPHVFAETGTSIDIVTQSDDGSGFGSPTTRSTITLNATGTGQAAVVNGPITDTWFRVNTANPVSTPNFTMAVFVGIG